MLKTGIKRQLLLITLLLFGLNVFAQESSQIDKVLDQLKLEKSKCKMDLVVSKLKPNNPDETIIVIPEIAYEEDDLFEFNSHILVVDTKTAEIKSQYFESYKTNGWTSDAIVLIKIKIDTAPYIVADNTRAFGVRVEYLGSSRVNPYGQETISLFTKDGLSLKQVLKNFPVNEDGGEWDGSCNGEFTDEKKILAMSKNPTNGYFDIIARSTISNLKAFLDKNDECTEKETISKKTNTLTYVTGKYQ